MKILVRFMGQLGEKMPRYDPTRGLSLEISDGANVKDLLHHLKMSKSQSWMVVLNGRVLKPDTPLVNDNCLYVVPAVFGG